GIAWRNISFAETAGAVTVGQTTGGTINASDLLSVNGQGSFNGPVKAGASTALVSGGTTSISLTLSSVSNFGIFVGTGSPSITAGTSSLYFRNDGSTATSRIYVNKDGGTTWTALLASG